MYRNLRVRRALLAFRQENNSYWSLVPLDLVNLTVQYLSPEVWSEQFKFELIWKVTLALPEKQNNIKSCFTTDLSVVIGYPEETPQRINLAGQITSCSQVVLPSTIPPLRSDGQAGFYYLDYHHKRGILLIHHYHPNEKVVYAEIYRQTDPANWFPVDFVMTTDETCYVLFQGIGAYVRNTLMLACYTTMDECPQSMAHFKPESIDRLDYTDNQMYFVNQAGRRMLQESTTQLKLSCRLPNTSPIDIVGPDDGDIFILTDHGVDLYQSKTRLINLPIHLFGLRCYLAPTGELLILLQHALNSNEFSLYRLY